MVFDTPGGSSEWEVDGNGDLVPKDDEPINVQSINTTTRSVDPNTASVQTAIDDLDGGTGGSVILTDSGSVDNPLELPSGIVLKSQGSADENDTQGVTLTPQNADTMLMLRDADGNLLPTNRTGGVFRAGVENVLFDGENTATAGGDLFGFQRCNFVNTEFRNIDGPAWDISGEGFTPGGVFYNNFILCHGKESERGMVWSDNGRGVNANVFIGGQLRGNQKEGLDADRSNANFFVGWITQNLQDGTYDPTARGTSDDPRRRVQLALRQSCTNNYIFTFLENTSESGIYLGEYVDGNTIDGFFNCAAPTISATTTNQRENNLPFARLYRSRTTGSDGSDTCYGRARTDFEPTFMLQSDGGYPIAVTGYKTDGDGFYQGINIQAKNFDGSDRSSETDYEVWLEYSGR
jgi:hypothetical protein